MQIELIDQHDARCHLVRVASMLWIEHRSSPRNIRYHGQGVAVTLAQHVERLDVAADAFDPKFVVLDVKPEAGYVGDARLCCSLDRCKLWLDVISPALQLD